nr:WecB/TagA/CpsF family glycosyltransferase [Vibrio cyclitrophicus]PMK96688.1 hypothetical protein BCT87_09340 [Vibrio cyclitrophicus]
MFKTKISDIPIDAFIDMDEAVETILCSGKGKIAVAINPEKILSSSSSDEVKKAILGADIRYLDGIGAVWLARRKLGKKVSRIPGCELWEEIMLASVNANKSVYLLGSTSDVVEKTKIKLMQDHNVEVCGCNNGFFDNDQEMIAKLLEIKPDILTVAMGSPRQELFMKKCQNAGLTSFMMGVGGTYNVYVGTVERAPKVWCKLNLEWLYRLLKEPTRLRRQLKLLKFVWLAILKKI